MSFTLNYMELGRVCGGMQIQWCLFYILIFLLCYPITSCALTENYDGANSYKMSRFQYKCELKLHYWAVKRTERYNKTRTIRAKYKTKLKYGIFKLKFCLTVNVQSPLYVFPSQRDKRLHLKLLIIISWWSHRSIYRLKTSFTKCIISQGVGI
jgi:hypothetical protein